MSFEIQQKIKQNATEIREYLGGLYEWQHEMELKQKAKKQLRQENPPPPPQPPPPRQQVPKSQPQKKKDLLRDVNTVNEYYKAWDKFDVNKQLQRLEEEQTRPYRPYNPYEDSKTNLRAKPQVKVNISGRRQVVSDPTELKDKGNLHFQSLEYDKAINCYTQSLEKVGDDDQPDKKKLRSVVLSNRAQAYLKINETVKALNDCNASLALDQRYSKSYYRRAECLKKLGRYRESLRDFEKVRNLEPNEGKAVVEIKKIEAFLAKRYREAREAMIVKYDPGLMLDGARIDIQEIDSLGLAANTTNYLEEL